MVIHQNRMHAINCIAIGMLITFSTRSVALKSIEIVDLTRIEPLSLTRPWLTPKPFRASRRLPSPSPSSSAHPHPYRPVFVLGVIFPILGSESPPIGRLMSSIWSWWAASKPWSPTCTSRRNRPTEIAPERDGNMRNLCELVASRIWRNKRNQKRNLINGDRPDRSLGFLGLYSCSMGSSNRRCSDPLALVPLLVVSKYRT